MYKYTARAKATAEISVGMDDWASENCAHTASFLNREALGAKHFTLVTFLGN
jgi:hypothetical protein